MESNQTRQNKKQQKQRPKRFSIDYGKLEADLQKQIQEDELYWLRNDAKMRAVTQGTPTYEDFRQIVLAAHLKPISKEEKEELQKKSAAGQVVWNSLAATAEENTRKCTDLTGGPCSSTIDLTLTDTDLPIPGTTTEFVKFWKSLQSSELKWRYLKVLLRSQGGINKSISHNSNNMGGLSSIAAKTNSGENLDSSENESTRRLFIPRNVFQRICVDEVPPEICSELIRCLLEVVTRGKGGENDELEDWGAAVHILYIVSQSKRYRLTLSFLTQKDTKNLDDVMNTLRGHLTKSREREVESIEELQGEAKILLDLFNVTESRIFPANHFEL